MDLKAFNTNRGNLKRKLSVIQNFMNNYKFQKSDVQLLEDKLQEVKKIEEEYATLNENWTTVVDDENEDQLTAKATEFESQLFNIQSSVKETIQMLKMIRRNGDDDDDDYHSDAGSQRSSRSRRGGEGDGNVMKLMEGFFKMFKDVQENQQQSMRVPEIKLPSFSGLAEHWTVFKGNFDDIIHNKSKYSNVEKFHYLNSCLPDNLKNEISRKFKLTSEGYLLAYDYLKEKFDNDRAVINKHFSELFHVKPISKESVKDLQALLGTFSANVDQLRQMKKDDELFSLFIVFLASSRLDDSTRKAWEFHAKSKDFPDWDDMRKFLSEQCKVLERIHYEKQLSKSGDSDPQSQGVKSKSNNVMKVFKPSTSLPVFQNSMPGVNPLPLNDQSFKVTLCVFCKGSHKSFKCPEFLKLSVPDRMQKVKSLNLCFNCLSAGHRSSDCSNRGCCFECTKMGKGGEKHHTLLHISRSSSGAQNFSVSQNSSGSQNCFVSQCSNGAQNFNPSQGSSAAQNFNPSQGSSVAQNFNPFQNSHGFHNFNSSQGLSGFQNLNSYSAPQYSYPYQSSGSSQNTSRNQYSNPQQSSSGSQNTSRNQDSIPVNLTGCSYSVCTKKRVILPTAVVNVVDKSGRNILCRALLDSGSQNGFITERLAQILGLKRIPVSVRVQGLSQNPILTKHCVKVKVKSRMSDYMETMEMLVVPKIAGNVPSQTIDVKGFKLPPGVESSHLADPSFSQSQPIDLLISAEYFMDLVTASEKYGCSNSSSNQLYLKKSVFGFLVIGKYLECEESKPSDSISCVATGHDELCKEVKKFWEVEKFESNKLMSAEENYCEELFQKTTKRNEDGRFVVTMPTRRNFYELKSNRGLAYKRFVANEYKLLKEPVKYDLYREFMDEFLKLGHMKEIQDDVSIGTHTYLPHHAVLKLGSTTTKLRVVFNASQKGENGLSFNDVLCTGPVVQSDLFSILIRFRMHVVMMTCDIQMMYRQVLLNPEQSELQRIFWRDYVGLKVKSYAIVTVIYGTSSASYLATRCLKQLAMDYKEKCPKASNILQYNTYMDDVLIGAETIEEGLKLQTQIRDITDSAKFHVRKWMSNKPELLSSVPTEDREKLDPNGKDYVTVLGLVWKPTRDVLLLPVKTFVKEETTTKRSVLKDNAGFFDPLGLHGPVSITGRMFFQKLWLMKIDWDDPLSEDLHHAWQIYREELNQLKSCEVERFVLLPNVTNVELHGFCDASQSAYGACLFMRSVTQGEIRVRLLCSKSKVAPLDKRTLPELELCGAELLARLSNRVMTELPMSVSRCVLWSDSTIVLSWLRLHPFNLKVFVGNRVASIQRLTSVEDWRHVVSELNPADCLSRGLMPGDLLNHRLWFGGPEFLLKSEEFWPKLPILEKANENEMTVSCLIVKDSDPIDIVQKCSSYRKLSRIFAYVNRFVHSLHRKNVHQGSLTVAEINQGLKTVIKLIQSECFPVETEVLEQKNFLHKKSPLQPLNPFIDKDGILRVGGRIDRATCSYDRRHPIILPGNHSFTEAIIRDCHKENLHSGQRSTLSFIRQKFWPLRAKYLIKKIIRECNVCAKLSAKPVKQFMGDLPSARVDLLFPFYRTGVDYCGPVYLRVGGVRSKTIAKAYIAVFVCMVTKAIHLELVSDMTTKAFMAALDRFYSAHGLAGHMYSDNGSNFVGTISELRRIQKSLQLSNGLDLASANSDLSDLYDMLRSEEFRSALSDRDASKGIQWHLMPPHAPEFGGIWESHVKIVKFHLKRVLGNAILNFEEMHTVLCKISAVVNSRPLYSESDDINDDRTITPGHFLIGRPLNSMPEIDVSDIPSNRLDRWQMLKKYQQQIRKSWYNDYLQCLQVRTKGFKEQVPISLGELVILKDDNIEQGKWPLARIVELCPGKDGIIRVVKVKTSAGSYLRPVTQICKLPFERQAFQGVDNVE